MRNREHMHSERPTRNFLKVFGIFSWQQRKYQILQRLQLLSELRNSNYCAYTKKSFTF